MEGKKVHLVEMCDELAPDENVRHRPLLLREIDKYVTVHTGYKGLEVTQNHIWFIILNQVWVIKNVRHTMIFFNSAIENILLQGFDEEFDRNDRTWKYCRLSMTPHRYQKQYKNMIEKKEGMCHGNN